MVFGYVGLPSFRNSWGLSFFVMLHCGLTGVFVPICYVVGIGVFFIVDGSTTNSVWWGWGVRTMYVIGGSVCGFIICKYLQKYWSGYRPITLRCKEGKNQVATVMVIVMLVCYSGLVLLDETIIQPLIFSLYPPQDAMTSVEQWLWEGLGFNGLITLVHVVSILVLIFYNRKRMDRNLRAIFCWKFFLGIPPIWFTYGLSFMRYINGWVTPDGEDYLPQAVNIGFIGAYTLLTVLVAWVWRERKISGSEGYREMEVQQSTDVSDEGSTASIEGEE